MPLSPAILEALSGPTHRPGGDTIYRLTCILLRGPVPAATAHTKNGVPSHPTPPAWFLPLNFLGLRLLVSMATWKALQLWFFEV